MMVYFSGFLHIIQAYFVLISIITLLSRVYLMLCVSFPVSKPSYPVITVNAHMFIDR